MSISSITNSTILNTLWDSIPETMLDPKVILTVGFLAGIYLFNKYGREQEKFGQIVALIVNNQELNDKDISPFDRLPNEILEGVLSFLPAEDLAQVSCVSTKLNELAKYIFEVSDLRELFPHVTFFLKKEWEYYAGFKIEVADPDKSQVIAAIINSPFFKKGERTLTFFLKPKDLTLRKVIVFGRGPLNGNVLPEIWILGEPFLEPFIDERSAENEYILITNTPLVEETKKQLFSVQKVVIECRKYELAGPIENLALPILNYVASGLEKRRLLRDDPEETTVVEVPKGCLVIKFRPSRLCVFYYDYARENNGVLAMRKFRPFSPAIDKDA